MVFQCVSIVFLWLDLVFLIFMIWASYVMFFLLILLSFLDFFFYNGLLFEWCRKKFKGLLGDSLDDDDMEDDKFSEFLKLEEEYRIPADQLQILTDNDSDPIYLGAGGFGSVYKAIVEHLYPDQIAGHLTKRMGKMLPEFKEWFSEACDWDGVRADLASESRAWACAGCRAASLCAALHIGHRA